jgi:hypothetical protein
MKVRNALGSTLDIAHSILPSALRDTRELAADRRQRIGGSASANASGPDHAMM